MLSRVQLFVTPWTAACQAPTSMGFYRQGYWSGLPFPSPGDLSDPGIEPRSPALQGRLSTSEPPGKSLHQNRILSYLSKGYLSPHPLKNNISFLDILSTLPACSKTSLGSLTSEEQSLVLFFLILTTKFVAL